MPARCATNPFAVISAINSTPSIVVLAIANSFIENKDKSTIPLSPSWKMHFLTGLDPLNMLCNCNVVKYTKAMEIQVNVDTKMKYLNNDNNLILIANKNKQATVLHNLKNYGGSFFNPVNKLAALIGIGPEAAVVKLDAGTATTGLCARMLTFTNIFAYQTTNALCALPTPNENGPTNFEDLQMFVPAPFLQNAVLEAITSCPFALIIASIEAHNPHIQEHTNDKDVDVDNISTRRNLFILWCISVAQGTFPEIRVSILSPPEQRGLQKTHEHTPPRMHYPNPCCSSSSSRQSRRHR
jgi:hypothetical protein